MLWSFFIFMELKPFFYSSVITKTLNLSNVKYKWAYFNQYSTISTNKRIYGTMISILYKMGEMYCVNFSYLWTQSYFSTILWSPRHWIWIMWNGNWCSWTNTHRQKYQSLYETIISIIYKTRRKYCGNSPFLELEPFPTIVCSPRHWIRLM